MHSRPEIERRKDAGADRSTIVEQKMDDSHGCRNKQRAHRALSRTRVHPVDSSNVELPLKSHRRKTASLSRIPRHKTDTSAAVVRRRARNRHVCRDFVSTSTRGIVFLEPENPPVEKDCFPAPPPTHRSRDTSRLPSFPPREPAFPRFSGERPTSQRPYNGWLAPREIESPLGEAW